MDAEVAELVRVAFEASPPKLAMNRMRILKALYLAKQELPQCNRLERKLPFYWYKHGPHSQIIHDTINALESDSILRRPKRKNPPYTPSPDWVKGPLTRYDDDLQEAASAITKTIKRFPDTASLVDMVCRRAPYKWYHSYHNDFMEAFGKYCDNFTKGKNAELYNTKAPMLHLLTKTEYTAPSNREFFDVRLAHNGFCRICNEVFATDHPSEDQKTFKDLKRLCAALWDVFACKVRILHHDDHYGDNVTYWESHYKSQLKKLKKEVERVEAMRGTVACGGIPRHREGRVAGVRSSPANAATPAEFRRVLDDMAAR